MEARCPKCKAKFKVKSESHVAGGKARAKKWTFEERSKAMKLAWARRREQAAKSNEENPTT
jgi:predicted Zn finger-like uncharacterized protein